MPEIYQLKVTLLGTKPLIWRRLLVPADLVLASLHGILQTAMGWQNSHFYEFRVGKQIYGRPNPEEVLPKVRSKLVYTYDMGDSWEHSVVVEKRLPADPNQTYPMCIGGERACPPEDSGGVPGFWGLLEAIEHPEEERGAEMLEWLGSEYDPAAFSVEDVNRALQRRRRKK